MANVLPHRSWCDFSTGSTSVGSCIRSNGRSLPRHIGIILDGNRATVAVEASATRVKSINVEQTNSTTF
jgi:hypothetical protein